MIVISILWEVEFRGRLGECPLMRGPRPSSGVWSNLPDKCLRSAFALTALNIWRFRFARFASSSPKRLLAIASTSSISVHVCSLTDQLEGSKQLPMDGRGLSSAFEARGKKVLRHS